MIKYVIGALIVIGLITFVVTRQGTGMPVATLTPTVSATPQQTSSPTVSTAPTKTPTPTPVKTATPTPSPTATPSSTPTPSPTPSPTPTVTPTPSQTPTPSPTTTPTPSPTPTPEPIITSVDNGNNSSSVKAGALIWIHGTNFTTTGPTRVDHLIIGQVNIVNGFGIEANGTTIDTSAQGVSQGYTGPLDVSVVSFDGAVSTLHNAITIIP